jgi:hypothetical protein
MDRRRGAAYEKQAAPATMGRIATMDEDRISGTGAINQGQIRL